MPVHPVHAIGPALLLALAGCGGGGGGGSDGGTSDAAAVTEQVSRASDLSPADDESCDSMLSRDGRYVVFRSSAGNLAPGAGDERFHVFRHDRRTGLTVRVDTTIDDASATGEAVNRPWISADGRYVAFDSSCGRLDASDTDAVLDVYLKDMDNGDLYRVSPAATTTALKAREASLGGMSADGRYVVFQTARDLKGVDLDQDGVDGIAGDVDIFRWTRGSNDLVRVSFTDGEAEPDRGCVAGTISDDGSRVAFVSSASDLHGIDEDGASDIFVRELDSLPVGTSAGRTRRISLTAANGETTAPCQMPMISGDGRSVVWYTRGALVPEDTNATRADAGDDIYRRTLPTLDSGETTRISIATGGEQMEAGAAAVSPWISPDGRYVAFCSTAGVFGSGNAVLHVVVRDTVDQTSSVVSDGHDGSPADGFADMPTLSGDGLWVSFSSNARNLLAPASPQAESEMQIFVAPRVGGNG